MLEATIEEQRNNLVSPIDTYKQECISAALKSARRATYANYGRQLEVLIGSNRFWESLITAKFKDQRVIELGPGHDPKADTILNRYGASKYLGVEPFYTKSTIREVSKCQGNIEIVNAEAIDFLSEQPDNSAIVMSCGVICSELFQEEIFSSRKIANDYLRFLGQEIYRVTLENNITLHLTYFEPFEIQMFFLDNGFEQINNAPIDANYRNIFLKPA